MTNNPFRLKFMTDQKGEVTGALMHRPDGVMTAKRKNREQTTDQHPGERVFQRVENGQIC